MIQTSPMTPRATSRWRNATGKRRSRPSALSASDLSRRAASPLLGLEVEVEVLQSSDAAHGQTEASRQPCGRPAIDQERGAVFQGAGGEVIRIVLARLCTHFDLADLAAPAAPMNVVRNDSRPVGGMYVKPLTRFGVGVQLKVLRGWHQPNYPSTGSSPVRQGGRHDHDRERQHYAQSQTVVILNR